MLQEGACAFVAFFLVACEKGSEDRAQLVVFVDTDATSIAQLGVDRSPAAAIDVVRIEGLEPNGNVFDSVELVVTDPSDFPISFGIRPTAARARMRIRAFSTATTIRSERDGEVAFEPSPRVALERVVDLDIPQSEKAGALVVLSADCFGRPSTFAPESTCIDAGPSRPFDEGILEIDPDEPPVSVIGTSPHGFLSECTLSKPDDERVCIAGGLGVHGSDELSDVSIDVIPLNAAPARLVAVSSFAMDRHEVTVGRFRTFLNETPGFDAPLPTVGVPNTLNRDCTWLGPSDGSHDTLPLSCVEVETAERFCQLLGGRLPTEAEWERAARGPGNANRYPWGDEAPDCCTASFGHGGLAPSCGVGVVEPVGSHSPEASCNGTGDRTAEGVEDLGGSLHELTRDGPAPYDSECWSVPGILANPWCDADSTVQRITRGGSWDDEGIETLSALRSAWSAVGSGMDDVGFRCVYPP